MSCCGINHELCHRQWKIIFAAGIMEIPKIHTNTKLAILFPYGDNVGCPRWLLNLTNESRLYEFVQVLTRGENVVAAAF